MDWIAGALTFLIAAAVQPASDQDTPPEIPVHIHVLSFPDLPIAPLGPILPTTAISADGDIVMVSLSSPGTMMTSGPSSEPAGTWVHDVAKGETHELHLVRDGKPWRLAGRSGLSADGRYVASACTPDAGPMPKWTPGMTMSPPVATTTIALIDRASGTNRFIDLREHGCAAPLSLPDSVSLSGDGSRLAISTTPDFGHHVDHGWAMLWSSADDSLRPLALDDAYYGLTGPELSADGHWLIGESFSKNEPRAGGLLRLDCAKGTSELVSLGPDDRRLIPYLRDHSLSADGQRVAFVSKDGDAQSATRTDVFVRDLGSGTTQRVSLARDGSDADGSSRSCVISGDGCYVAFVSDALNLVAQLDDAPPDLFVRELASGRTVRVGVEDFAPDARMVYLPALSHNGRRVVFCVDIATQPTRVVLADIDWAVNEGAPQR
ncbi:MAG TPA: hypothetical protein VFY71_06960 [Planctomycetota bacterium]|nr:hypothetical protein [Planctomycetota bacterium]